MAEMVDMDHPYPEKSHKALCAFGVKEMHVCFDDGRTFNDANHMTYDIAKMIES